MAAATSVQECCLPVVAWVSSPDIFLWLRRAVLEQFDLTCTSALRKKTRRVAIHKALGLEAGWWQRQSMVITSFQEKGVHTVHQRNPSPDSAQSHGQPFPQQLLDPSSPSGNSPHSRKEGRKNQFTEAHTNPAGIIALRSPKVSQTTQIGPTHSNLDQSGTGRKCESLPKRLRGGILGTSKHNQAPKWQPPRWPGRQLAEPVQKGGR